MKYLVVNKEKYKMPQFYDFVILKFDILCSTIGQLRLVRESTRHPYMPSGKRHQDLVFLGGLSVCFLYKKFTSLFFGSDAFRITRPLLYNL